MLFNKDNVNNYKHLIESLQKDSSAVELSAQSREKVKKVLFHRLMSASQMTIDKGSMASMIIQLRSVRIIITASVIIGLGLSGLVGMARADASKPGDRLYVLDRVLERVQLAITFNPDKDLQLKLANAAERLQEMAELAKENDDATDDDSEDVQLAFHDVQGELNDLSHDVGALDTDSNADALAGQVQALFDREHDISDLISAPAVQRISICHKETELMIPQSAWSSHSHHGDYVGPCSSAQIVINGSDDKSHVDTAHEIVKDENVNPISAADGENNPKASGSMQPSSTKVKLNGIIESIDTVTMKVMGQTIRLDQYVTLQGRGKENTILEVGRWVEITGIELADNSVRATKIKVK